MQRYEGEHKNLRVCFLENEYIRLAIAPQLGGKMTSLVYKPQAFEVLFQPTLGEYRLPEYGADFSRYDTSGADEMFPTIDACSYPYEEYAGNLLPDHGDLWSIPWQVAPKEAGWELHVMGRSLPYHFIKFFELKENILHMEYKVINTGDKPFYGLWAFHGLVACDNQTEILLPGTHQVINVHKSRVLGDIDTSHSFPETVSLDGSVYQLDRISPAEKGKTEKFYIKGVVPSGEASLTLNQGQLLYTVAFPKEKVPYLGVWINEGGFKGEYNCALEPSTGYYDAVDEAKRRNTLTALLPGEAIEWFLDIELSPRT